MRHEIEEKAQIYITDGLYTFEDIYNKPYTPKELIENIKKAEILFLPYEDFRERNEFLFAEETYKLYSYFLEHKQNADLNVDICSSDENYYELELHAEVINIPLLIVQWLVLPTVTSMIGSYLFGKMVKFMKNDMNTKVSITVEKDGKAKTIHYEGSAKDFESTMKSIDEHIFK